jgi:hypothetical protein
MPDFFLLFAICNLLLTFYFHFYYNYRTADQKTPDDAPCLPVCIKMMPVCDGWMYMK